MRGLSSGKVGPLLLRTGLAFVFVYAAVSSLMHPDQWVGWLPSFIQKMSSAETLLQIFSIGELLLALALLAGWYTRYAALLAAAALLGIVIASPHALDVTFRDIGLMFMAVALASLET